jgi:small subunit ribosomal protein S20
MPNTKSAAKAMRQSVRRRANNIRTKNKFKVAIKDVRKALDAASKDEAAKALRLAMATLDKAAKKGVIHKNTASRKKSRLAKAINKLK